MAKCITCGTELHPERAQKYNYCMAPECQAKNAKGLTIAAVGMNKSGEEFVILDDQARAELASGKYHDPRRGSFGTSQPALPASAARAAAARAPHAPTAGDPRGPAAGGAATPSPRGAAVPASGGTAAPAAPAAGSAATPSPRGAAVPASGGTAAPAAPAADSAATPSPRGAAVPASGGTAAPAGAARRPRPQPQPRLRPQAPARGPWTGRQERLALLYNEQGLRPDEIADKLGISRYLASQIILTAKNRGKL
jgi:hypothetical protein